MWQSVIMNEPRDRIEDRNPVSPAGYQTGQLPAAESTARFVNTRIISRRYSGVRAEVVKGLLIFAARSPAASARASSITFPFNNSPALFTRSGAGLTAVMPMRASVTCPLDRFITTATPAKG